MLVSDLGQVRMHTERAAGGPGVEDRKGVMTTNEAPRGIDVGTTLTTAMISPVSGGLIRTWTELESRLWSVEDADGLRQITGRGLIGRTAVPDNRFREAALLDPEGGTLIVQSRFAHRSGESAQVEAAVFRLAAPARPTTNPWTELREFLAAAAVSAVMRGEFWVAELGGWDSPNEPYCLFGVLDDRDGPVSLVEAAPAPRGTGIWPEVPVDQPGSAVRAPANDDSVRAVGMFAVAALNSWGWQPWDMTLTFGTFPG